MLVSSTTNAGSASALPAGLPPAPPTGTDVEAHGLWACWPEDLGIGRTTLAAELIVATSTVSDPVSYFLGELAGHCATANQTAVTFGYRAVERAAVELCAPHAPRARAGRGHMARWVEHDVISCMRCSTRRVAALLG